MKINKIYPTLSGRILRKCWANLQSQRDFTLVELLITMFIFVLALAASSRIFTTMVTQFKQQSKIAETNIEGAIGLKILQNDLEHAGYGLPWNITGLVTVWTSLTGYCEAKSLTTVTPNPANFNDGIISTSCSITTACTANCQSPKAVISDDNADFNGSNNIFDGSDYLVIKAINMATSNTSQRSSYVDSSNNVKQWTSAGTDENFATNDRVTVISPGTTTSNSRSLVVVSLSISNRYFTLYNSSDQLDGSGFTPTETYERNLVYGVDPDTDLRMPFNRADYYINSVAPDRCANGTGVLRKALISQSNGTRANPLPLLDCVADMQVAYGLDTNDDGTINAYTNDLTASGLTTAQNIRDQVREIRVYVLANEGQRDPNLDYSQGGTITTIDV